MCSTCHQLSLYIIIILIVFFFIFHSPKFTHTLMFIHPFCSMHPHDTRSHIPHLHICPTCTYTPRALIPHVHICPPPLPPQPYVTRKLKESATLKPIETEVTDPKTGKTVVEKKTPSMDEAVEHELGTKYAIIQPNKWQPENMYGVATLVGNGATLVGKMVSRGKEGNDHNPPCCPPTYP